MIDLNWVWGDVALNHNVSPWPMSQVRIGRMRVEPMSECE